MLAIKKSEEFMNPENEQREFQSHQLLEYSKNMDYLHLPPIFEAIWRQDIRMLRALLENNANINKITFLGVSPLHYSLFLQNGSIEVSKLLLFYGADIKEIDNNVVLSISLNDLLQENYEDRRVIHQVSIALNNIKYFNGIKDVLLEQQIQSKKNLIILALKTQLAAGIKGEFVDYAIKSINELYKDMNILGLILEANKMDVIRTLSVINSTYIDSRICLGKDYLDKLFESFPPANKEQEVESITTASSTELINFTSCFGFCGYFNKIYDNYYI
ncbi:MAG: hypothetical protein K0Q51_626 [Rickettsiaceae bacterium]|jgi:hypothetical protein|nr:hypothetical protein [Rickettsiaceae bacterium]